MTRARASLNAALDGEKFYQLTIKKYFYNFIKINSVIFTM